MQVFGIGSLVIFRIPYFVGKGFAQSTVAWGLSSEGVSAILVALFLGFFMERVPVRYLGATGFLIMVTSAIVTMAATQTWQMVSAFFLFGMAIAILNVVQNTLWPAYFGRENVGTIRGMALLISLPFAATGAPAAGFVQDATGSYFQVWWIAIALMLASAALMFTTPPPSGKQTAV
jgi:predicted MFS family arabinose efflux permease